MVEKFNIIKNGYDQSEVTAYIDELENRLNAYKEKDNAIKNFIISAQIASSNIIKNALIEADKIKNGAIAGFDEVASEIERKRPILKQFKEDCETLHRKYVTEFNSASIKELFAKINNLEEYANRLNES
ncbi:MAG: DivIVA domain-containing protein [Clostridiales bacterium]|jgi:cell division septum initiation protein DivIVA|nr:DivIVA domain-containing protein [Clostridiales bacterium]